MIFKIYWEILIGCGLTIGLTTQELSSLFQILQSDSDLNNLMHLTPEAEKVLSQVE